VVVDDAGCSRSKKGGVRLMGWCGSSGGWLYEVLQQSTCHSVLEWLKAVVWRGPETDGCYGVGWD